MKQKRSIEEHLGITRREFVQYTAAAGAILSVPGLLSGCSHSDSDSTSGINTETRNYYFDLANADPSHDYLLKVGAHFMPLTKMDAAARTAARNRNSFLTLVPDENLTHHLEEASLPSDAITLCWIVGKDPSAKDGAWNMPMMFYHVPLSALAAARTRPNANSAPGADKLRHYGVTAAPASVGGDDIHLLEDELKNPSDTAVSIIASHPEMLCAEPNSHTHIVKNIITPNPLTFSLTLSISSQGTASETGGWATQEVYINEDTGQPYLNSQGQKQYFPAWSDRTLAAAGPAISSSLEVAKDDLTLGTNVTSLDPSEDNSLQTLGTIWYVRDGITTVDASLATARGADDHESLRFKNHSTKNGYNATYFFYAGDERTITIEVENKYLRYLGLYIRFLDGSGSPIPVSELDDDILSYFPVWARQSDQDFSTDYDLMGMMIGPELVILGVPIKSDKQQFTFKVPLAATKVEVLAGGLGHGGVSGYPEMVHYTGQVPTIILNLAVPMIFLALSAGTGYAQFMKNSAGAPLLRLILGFIFDLSMSIYLSAAYRAPRSWLPVAKDLFLMLLKAPWLVKEIQAYSDEGEVLDQVPGFGTALQVLAAIGTTVGIAETIEEVARSPSIYKYTLSYTHDINVTINHDENDFEFPATATHYELKAYFDGGTPQNSGRIKMPGTSWSDPLSYTFSQVPKGGKVQIVVGFYSDTLWLAGKGKTNLVPNDETAAQLYITIKEMLVPLTSDTQYSHKEKTALDDNGDLVWEAGGAPTKTKTDLSCLNQNGDLCELACITVSETFAAAGYSWKSFSTDVVSCDNGAHGQLFQFANISIDQNPESGHKTSGCGFSELVRIVYDLKDSPDENFYLDTTGGGRLVRQIRLTQDQPPDFDGPDSNKAWGKFSNPSHALVLHPQQKLISINSTVNKIEVLDLAQGVTTDDLAPLAEVHSATGTRSGLISGPICAAVAPDGTILVLESNNQRIQAFDIGGNPVKHFGANKDEYFVPLKEETTAATYLDMAVEYVGYIYVLSYTTEQGLYQYRLDIYSPQGEFLSRTTEVNASKLDVDLWRNIYTLNYEQLLHTDQSLPTVTEPSVSEWIPSTPT